MHDTVNAQLRYVHGNRLERLAGRLAADLAAGPNDDPLATEIIVVPHPGMGRWLQRELARHWGVAMRLELPLPGRLIWRLATGLAGIDEADASYDIGPLAFRIQAQLEAWARAQWRGAPRELPRPRDALARWSLAERLAGLFDQYQVYRPDWIRAWDQGAEPRGLPRQGAWQGQLWRALRSGGAAPHRAEVLAIAMRALDSPTASSRVVLPARVSVFGVSTLPEPYLLFFAQLAHRAELAWYHPNASAAYWGDIVSERERARTLARLRRLGRRELDTHYDVAHPLLASLGGIGRDFVRALHGQGIAAVNDEDDFDIPASDTLLGWLQAGIVLLDPCHAPPPLLAREGSGGLKPTLSGAALDLRVHACPNRLREVEVLHDVLLGLFDELESLRPHEIVVMSPRPAEYAPLVRAVFDAAPASRRLPYTISDRSLAAMHPLLALFLELLDLPDERFTATRVLGWLATPAIARRHDLDAEALEWLRVLVAGAGIRWGLDGASRAAAGSTGSALYSWRFGLDRLMLGYACGATDDLVAGVAPYAGIEGRSALAAGALSTFVERLAAWSERLRAPRTATAWRDALTGMLASLLEREHADDPEADAFTAIAATLAGWEADAAAGDASELEIEHGVMRAALAARFGEAPGAQSFPGSGVTVCAMVPMRNLPFRVVCLLGLNGGEFPRPPVGTGLDLMAQAPRPGDRSLAADDRYLFLESLMSAREHLHLSYVGSEGRDLAARPPGAVLAELLDFIVASYPAAARAAASKALVFHHRLHPFARDYFDTDAAFHSYAAEWIAPHTPPLEPPPAVATEPRQEFELAEIARYAHDPQRYFAERVLRLALPGDNAIEDEEPLALNALDAYWLRDRARVLRERGVFHDARDLLPRLTAEALLPIGIAGRAACAEAVAIVDAIRRTRIALIDDGGQLPDVDLDTRVGTWRVSGRIDGVTTAGLIHTRVGQLRGGDWMRLALEAWLLRAQSIAPGPAWGIDVAQQNVRLSRLNLDALDDAWARAVLQSLEDAQRERPPLLRHASWAYAKSFGKGREAALRDAHTAFRGYTGNGGDLEDDATWLLCGGRSPLDAAFERAAEALLVPVANGIEVLK